MTRDREPIEDEIPEPDAEPTAAEKARARSFGDLVDRAIAGRGMPAAMSADDRALVEVATVIRGAAGKLELDADRAASLVDAALVAAVDKDPHRPRSASLPPPLGAAVPAAEVVPIRSTPRRRYLPWSIAAVSTAIAAAAVAMLAIGVGRRGPAPAPAAPPLRAQLPETQRSRPADDLVGVITRDRDGDAATRIDAIYADRLDGYRELALGPTRPRGGAR